MERILSGNFATAVKEFYAGNFIILQVNNPEKLIFSSFHPNI
jgi:hypothetical protein